MSLFGNLRRWLRGSFTCVRCGREFHVMTFGCGTAVCPDCYSGEQPFLFFDDGFWLNRVMMKIMCQREPRSGLSDDDLVLLQAFEESEVEVVG